MFDCNTFIRRMGWTQKDLAQKLDVGTSTVGMWCVGKSTPAYSVMIELFKLGMTPEEMHEVFAAWNETELDSYLIEITRDILGYKDENGETVVTPDTVQDRNIRRTVKFAKE